MEAEPVKRRSCKFSLRTLIIAVTLLAVPLGYVGWQAKIERERLAMRDWIRSNGGYFPTSTSSEGFYGSELSRWSGSWIRGRLGDFDAVYVVVPNGTSDEKLCQVKAVFPDAEVTR
jgi:hypothetical protein